MHHPRLILPRTFFYALLISGVTSLVGPVMAAANSRATPVKVASAKQVKMAPQTWVAGTVISRHEAQLATEVSGKLEHIVEVGTQVTEGQAVARIDPTFAKLKTEEYEAAVGRDHARLEFLKGEVQRLNRLAKQNNASQTLLERTRADREVAHNELRISRTRLKHAQEEERRHVIYAPFSGVITERFMHRGERADIGDGVVKLVDSHTQEIQARVPLQTLDYVKSGDLLRLKINGHETKSPVRALVTVGDERSRLLDLRITAKNKNWVIGQSVRVALPTAMAKKVLAVPRDALVLRRDGAFVFRINKENKAERIAVTLGVASGPQVEVIGNIQINDQVVIRGGERLRPGSTVKILGGEKSPGGKPNGEPDNNPDNNQKIGK